MNICDKSVTRGFRAALAEELPGLGTHKDYWLMTQHLLFGTWHDVDTGLLMISAELLAAIEGKPSNHHYNAMTFLDRYRTQVLDFSIQESVLHSDPDRCKVRSVKQITLPVRVQELVEAERRTRDSDRVWMSTGNTAMRKHSSEQRKADRAKVNQQAQGGFVNLSTRLLLDYLNALPPHRFTAALKHLPEAMEAAATLSDAENQLNLLTSIRDYAQPFYVPVDKTTRVYSLRESVLRLHRDLRKIMTQDWITADLKSAQLAIVATVWDVPSLRDYLREGKSVWRDLCGHMGVGFTDDHKAGMKTALYALVYGAGDQRLEAHMAKHFGTTLPGESGKDIFGAFKRHPVIRSLLLARGRQLKKIRNESGGEDAFGNFTAIVKTRKDGYGFEYDNARSILACIAQSYEIKLLLPAIQMAVTEQFGSHGFTLTTFLHDGFTFDVHHASDREDWTEKLALAVKNEAATYGIITELEFS